MKASKSTYLLAIVVALSFTVVGCKTKPKVTPLPKYGDTVPGPNRGLEGTQPLRPTDRTEGVTQQELPTSWSDPSRFNQNREALKAHTVHFDYDSTAIRSGERANIAAVASYLNANAGVGLLVEGHCDERGTEEYNRSLGERRALALREALMAAGADGSRITTLSFGKDKKVDQGNSEAAHARNRRGEFVVLTPK